MPFNSDANNHDVNGVSSHWTSLGRDAVGLLNIPGALCYSGAMAQILSGWPSRKGLHDLGNGSHPYLHLDGSWGWSRSISAIAVCLCAVFWLLRSTAAASGQFDRACFETATVPFIQHALVADNVAGVQVAVVVDGQMVWSRGFGWANIERKVPVDNQTVFRAASISKLFTTTAVMREVEAGHIGLDDDVNEHLEQAERVRDTNGREVKVTLHQLLSHTSGLPVSWGSIGGIYYTMRTSFPGKVKPPPQITMNEYLSSGLVLDHPPGGPIVYANDGFVLVGFLVTRLSGDQNFADHVRKTVFEPLEMKSSAFDNPQDLLVRLSTPYLGQTGRFSAVDYGETAVPGLQPNPAGSLITSAEDLARFAEMVIAGGALNGRRILNEATLEQMETLYAKQDPRLDSGYGVGFTVGRYRGHHLIAHDGGLAGVATRLAIMPTEKLAVAVLTNSSNARATHEIADRIFDQLLRDTSVFDPELAVRRPTPRRWRELSGYYQALGFVPPRIRLLQRLGQTKVNADHGLLTIDAGSFGRYVLEPTDEQDVFVLHGEPGEGERFAFRLDGGRVSAAGDILRLQRVPWYASLPALVLYGAIVMLAIVLLLGRWVMRRAARLYRRVTA